MKKLLIFAKTLDGGTGTYLNTLLKIRDINNKDFIISGAALEKPVYMQQSAYEFHFMKKRDYSLDKYSFSYNNLSEFIKEFFWFRKIILKEMPDIILSVDVNCNIHAGLNKFLYRKNLKTIFTTHSDLDGNLDQKTTKFLKFLLKKIINFFYSRADLNICVSKNLSNSLTSNFGIKSKPITIFNGVELPLSHKEFFEPGNNRILTVARLDKQKDHLTLLKAFKLVTKKIKNAHLLLAGDGPLKNELENFVAISNLDNNVEFIGWQNKINELFIDSDIFVLSSNREGFPYALIEAMSFGLPVVCTDTPYGPGEILDGGKYGYLVPMKDHIKMKEAILQLLENKEIYKKYSQLALERSHLYTSERMVNEYTAVIKELVKD
jgi:glycosyltransferase involved in cell wall biosynthesis